MIAKPQAAASSLQHSATAETNSSMTRFPLSSKAAAAELFSGNFQSTASELSLLNLSGEGVVAVACLANIIYSFGMLFASVIHR